MKDINWVGFYVMEECGDSRETDGISVEKKEQLVLGPFQGKPACVEIKVGRGVCGTAVEKDEVK